MKHLVAVDCVAAPFAERHPGLVHHWLRGRGDVVERALAGDAAYVRGFNDAADRVSREYNLSVVKIPSFIPAQLETVVMSSLMDCVQTTYDVDGFPVSPEAVPANGPRWESFRAAHEPNPRRDVADVLQTYRDIAASVAGKSCGMVVHPPYRLEASHPDIAKRIADITLGVVHLLPALGWEVFPVPADATPSPDGYWVHYDGAWAREFMERNLLRLGVES